MTSTPQGLKYSRTSEIETANLSQSQFQAYYLFHRNSSTATKNDGNMRLMLKIKLKKFLNCHVIHSSLIIKLMNA